MSLWSPVEGEEPDDDPWALRQPGTVVSVSDVDSFQTRDVEQAPPWVMPVIRATIWRVIWVGLGMAVLVLSLLKARGLVGAIIIAIFFSVAMDPAVTHLNVRRGWRRGVATTVIVLSVLVAVVLLIAVLVPAMVTVAGQIGDRLPGWISGAEKTFGITIADPAGSGNQLSDMVKKWLQDHGSALLGVAGSTAGLAFQVLTILTFTFYFTVDAPAIRRAVLGRIPPERQERLGWAWDTAIQQTGGYFYSRLLLLVINASLFFFVMIAVGTPWLVALPLALFQGFFAEFIPVVGTYIGVAVPTIVVLGTQGIWQALILVAWTLLYQQVENYFLNPRLSAKTMEINGGVAFGAALAGGAVAGPMGAFMAMPMAALITSFVKHYVRRYEVTFRSAYDGDLDVPANRQDRCTQGSDLQARQRSEVVARPDVR